MWHVILMDASLQVDSMEALVWLALGTIFSVAIDASSYAH